jgi:hypothetical protein
MKDLRYKADVKWNNEINMLELVLSSDYTSLLGLNPEDELYVITKVTTRFAWACGVLAFVPVLRQLRLARSISRRPSLIPTFFSSVPVLLVVYMAAACGEAAGYLFGLGDAEEKFVKWELNTPRIA